MFRGRCLLLVCAMLFVLPFTEAESQISHDVGAAEVPEIFLASSVAYRDMNNHLRAEYERTAKIGGHIDLKAQQYSFDIRNYSIEIFEKLGRVYISFTLRPMPDGTAFLGGIERYIIDEKTSTVIEHTGER